MVKNILFKDKNYAITILLTFVLDILSSITGQEKEMENTKFERM